MAAWRAAYTQNAASAQRTTPPQGSVLSQSAASAQRVTPPQGLAGVDLETPPGGSPTLTPSPATRDLPPGHPSGPSATQSAAFSPAAPAPPAAPTRDDLPPASPSPEAPAAPPAPSADLAPAPAPSPAAVQAAAPASAPTEDGSAAGTPWTDAGFSPPPGAAPPAAAPPPAAPPPHVPSAPPARPSRPGRFKAPAVVAAMAVVIAAASVGTIMAMSGHGSSPGSHTSAGGSSGPAAATTAAASAAAWVSAQVSPTTGISCDQAMCTMLKAHGYPAKHLNLLSADTTLKTALRTSAVVMVTPATQQLFGSSLVTAWAPAALATFGSGDSAVSVRLAAPSGAAAYEQKARKDQAALATPEAGLTQTKSVTVSGAPAQDLMSGRVDGRLMEAIADAATAEPIDIVDFGNVGTGASAYVPLRYADLRANGSAAGMSEPAYVQALEAGLSGGAGFHPDRTQVLTLRGQQVLRVEFLAPTPFNVLNNP
jgi:hypothetical protein